MTKAYYCTQSYMEAKSELTILLEKYNRLMEESHELSTTNRKESDKKFVDAQEVLVNIDRIERDSVY